MTTPKRKILIADDDYSTRRLLAQIVRSRFDCHILQAEDGSEALKMMVDEMPDVVILDMLMPFMNGLQVLKTMKANDKLSHIPVIACTAVDDNSVVKEIIRLGVVHYVKKPVSRESIVEKLDRVFGAPAEE